MAEPSSGWKLASLAAQAVRLGMVGPWNQLNPLVNYDVIRHARIKCPHVRRAVESALHPVAWFLGSLLQDFFAFYRAGIQLSSQPIATAL
jgi:hypothetical protein